jgi:hypothetical protein
MGDEHTVSHGVIRMVVSVEDKTHGFGGDGFYVRKDVFSRPRKIRVDNQYIVAKYNEAHISLFVHAEVTSPIVNISSKLMHAILRVTWLTCP